MLKEYIKKLTKWIGIPLILLFLAMVLSGVYFFNSETAPNILSINHPAKTIQNIKGIISGIFTAQENNLAEVTVKFNIKKPLSGNSIFRIKNVLDKDWYYEATIPASLYSTTPDFMFIIPTMIARSKNQTYQLEIHLLGDVPKGRDLMVSNTNYPFVSHYQYSKDLFIKDEGLLFDYVVKKILYYSSEKSFWGIVWVYSIPIVLYLFFNVFESMLLPFEFVTRGKKKLSSILTPYMLLILFYLGTLIFIRPKSSNAVDPLFILLWIFAVIAYRLKSQYSFGVALTLLILCPFLLSENMDWIAERLGIWVYMFLIMGTIHIALELQTDRFPKICPILNKLCVGDKIAFLISHFDSFIQTCVKNIVSFALFSIRNFLTIVILFVLTTLLFFAGLNLYFQVMRYRHRQLMNPHIQLIEPTLVYPGTKIIILGENFGDNSNKKYALICDGERVRPDYWEDHKIILTVPLNWKKPGVINFLVEKPIEWDGKTVIEKTKPLPVKLLKVTDHYTPDDNLYFEQIKTWKKETREINGYE